MSCPVLLTCCRSDFGRYSNFDEYWHRLDMPSGSKRAQFRGPSIAKTRNLAVQTALEVGAEFLVFIDDDHVFGPDLVTRLVGHDQPIVSAVYLMRGWPFHVCAWERWGREGQDPAKLGPTPPGEPVVLRKGRHGLRRIVAAGCGALCVRRDVLEKLGPKPFSCVYAETDQIAEDFSFFRKAWDAHIPAYIDFETVVGHQTTLEIWPVREDREREWFTGLISGEELIPVPSAISLLEEREVEKKARELAEASVVVGSRLMDANGRPL